METNISFIENVKIIANNICKGVGRAILPRAAALVDIIISTKNEVESAVAEHLLRNTNEYIMSILNENLTADQLNYIVEIFNDPATAGQEGLRVLTILNNSIDTEKAYLLARLTIATAKKLLTPSEFKNYSELLNTILYTDLEELMKEWPKLNDDCVLITDMDNVSLHRLNYFGIGQIVFDSDDSLNGNRPSQSNIYYNPYSQKFVNIITGNYSKKIKNSKTNFITSSNTSPMDAPIYYKIIDKID